MELESLRNKRKALKALCTRINNYTNSIVDLNNEVIVQIRTRKEKFDTYWNKYDEMQSQIKSLEQNTDYSDREHFENAYFNLVVNTVYVR